MKHLLQEKCINYFLNIHVLWQTLKNALMLLSTHVIVTLVICVLDINIYFFNVADMKIDTLNILKCVLSAEKDQYQEATLRNVKH